MLTTNKKIIVMFILCITVTLMALVFFFKPMQDSGNLLHNNESTNPATLDGANAQVSNVENTAKSKQLPILSNSLAGSQIDCPLRIDSKGQLILTRGIRDCFDYFFSTIGEKSEGQIILDIQQYLTATLPPTASPYAISLLQKYIEYKKALAIFQKEQNIKVEDSKTYAQVVNAMRALQQKYFTLIETQALFGFENVFNVYTIEQMKIHENTKLSTAQKAEKMSALIDELPPEMAEGIKASAQFNELQQLTKEIQERGGSASELRAMREKLVGVEASNRLEQVDSEEAHWQSKVNQYLAQRDQINTSGMDSAGKQQAIESMRQNTFNTKEELIRSQTYEQMHDSKNNGKIKS